jgi:Spy/CpxP family protein refolding chaperone
MTDRIRRLGLAAGTLLIVLGTAAGILAASHSQNTNDAQPAFSPRRGGPAPGMFGLGPMGMLGPILPRLDLTSAQRDQVKTIMESHAADFKTLRDQGAPAHKALEQAILTDPVDDNAVAAASAQVAAVDAQLAVLAAHVRAEVFQVLTDAQKAQVKEVIAERDTRAAGGRRGRGGQRQ